MVPPSNGNVKPSRGERFWGWVTKAGSLVTLLTFVASLVLGIFGTLEDWGVRMDVVYWSWMSVSLVIGLAVLSINLFLLFRKPRFPESLPDKEVCPEKIYTHRTVKEIAEEAHRHINRDFTSPEIGKWYRVDDESLYIPDTTFDPIKLTVGKSFEQVDLYFDSIKWRARLARVKQGDRIVAEGRISEVGFHGMSLHDCAFVEEG